MSIKAHLGALHPGAPRNSKHAIPGSDTSQSQLLGDELKDASRGLISELLSESDAGHDRTMCLPEELLALCFTFLPFRGRVFASHVSRRWRSISLNNPEIWADMGSGLLSRHQPDLFEMVLNRTGSLPVDLSDCPDQHDGIEDLLVDHMHHIRSLYYLRVLHSAPLTCPAPHLETFVCHARDAVTIRIDFLGGTVGRLRKLQLRTVSFPAKCPALSTVTDLSLNGPTSAYYGTHFNLLFQLFPVLRSLTLTNLKRSVSAALPSGPLSASLQSLNLSSGDPGYDLSQLYATWHSDAPIRIEISHDAALSQHVVHLVDAAHTIDVQHDAVMGTSVLTVTGPGSRLRRLEYLEDDADQRDLAVHLMGIPSPLRSVRVMSVPASSLEPFLAVFAVLPKLVQITLIIDAPDAYESRWTVLDPLARFEHRGQLQSLVLHVDYVLHAGYVGAPCEPSARDAEGLLAQLATLAHAPLPDITVTGFPPAILPDASLPAFSAFSVTFGSTDEPAVAQA